MPRTSIKILPVNYYHYKTLDLHDSKTMLILNLIAIGNLFLSISVFNKLLNLIRPDILETHTRSGLPLSINILYVFSVFVIVIIVHELIHALFFWMNTREMPVFAFKFLYAYTAAPDWFIPRLNFVVIGLSPVVLMTLIVIFSIMIAPPSLAFLLSLAGILNFAGSTGDFAVVFWILAQPKDCLFKDSGDSFEAYHQRLDNDKYKPIN